MVQLYGARLQPAIFSLREEMWTTGLLAVMYDYQNAAVSEPPICSNINQFCHRSWHSNIDIRRNTLVWYTGRAICCPYVCV